MKKILFSLSLFFIAPFLTHASETVQTVNLDYTNTYSKYFNTYLPVFDGEVSDFLLYLRSYYESQNANFIITINPNNVSNFEVYFVSDINKVTLRSSSQNGKTSGLYLDNQGNSKTCRFTNLNQYSGNYQEKFTYCDSLDMEPETKYYSLVSGSADKNDIFTPYTGSTMSIPYYSSFEVLNMKKNNLSFGVVSSLGTIDPIGEDNSAYFFYANYYDDDLMGKYLLPKPTFKIKNKDTDSNDKITGIEFTVSWNIFDLNKYEYSAKRPWEDTFTSFGSNNGTSFYTDKNGSFVFKVKSGSTEKSYSYTVDWIGKPKTELEDYLNGKDEQTEEENFFIKLFSSWLAMIEKNFPIFWQINDFFTFLSAPDYTTGVCKNAGITNYKTVIQSGKYCMPEFKADFSFIGINKEFEIINYNFYSDYRNFIIFVINTFVAFLTFLKVVHVIGGYMRNG